MTITKDAPNWTPWLLIRNSLADTGTRPLPQPEEFCWWASPDIWIESSDPAGGIVANEDNYVHARVHNLGAADAFPVRVEFYWARSSPVLNPSNMVLIGTEWLEIPALSSREIRCNTPWTPVADTTILSQTVVVQTSDPILDPIQYPFQPILDRHVGPYNLAVVCAPFAKTVPLVLSVQNPFPLHAKTSIWIRTSHLSPTERTVKKVLSKQLIPSVLETELLIFGTKSKKAMDSPPDIGSSSVKGFFLENRRRSEAAFKRPRFQEKDRRAAASPRVWAQFSQRKSYTGADLSSSAFSDMALALETLNSAIGPSNSGRDLVVEEAMFNPFEERDLHLELDIPPSVQSGELMLIHIQQRAEQMVVGGYSVVVGREDDKEAVEKR